MNARAFLLTALLGSTTSCGHAASEAQTPVPTPTPTEPAEPATLEPPAPTHATAPVETTPPTETPTLNDPLMAGSEVVRDGLGRRCVSSGALTRVGPTWTCEGANGERVRVRSRYELPEPVVSVE